LAEAKRASARQRTPPMPHLDWAWFFDVDGTLVEIASSPSSVVVHHELPELIAQLHFLSGGAVSLITGRAVADVDRFLPMPGISVAGQHGLELRTEAGVSIPASSFDTDFHDIRVALEDAAARHPGLFVEFKGESIALHYRNAPRLAGYAHRLMRSLRERHAPDFAIRKGKRVVELTHHTADKGEAIRKLMKTEPFKGRIPVFLGDDVTDEAGFAVVNQLSGISIKVGPGRTVAAWRLGDVSAVRQWLRSGMSSMAAGPTRNE
jgi:trehalose 6-phosphate phosphatase